MFETLQMPQENNYERKQSHAFSAQQFSYAAVCSI